MKLHEQIKVMQAFAKGQAVEVCNTGTTQWGQAYAPCWNWSKYDYRIKSVPESRWFIKFTDGFSSTSFANKQLAERYYGVGVHPVVEFKEVI